MILGLYTNYLVIKISDHRDILIYGIEINSMFEARLRFEFLIMCKTQLSHFERDGVRFLFLPDIVLCG